MAGKIVWKIEIIGLEGVIRQLREIDRLLGRITQRRSGIFLGMSGIKSLDDLKEAQALINASKGKGNLSATLNRSQLLKGQPTPSTQAAQAFAQQQQGQPQVPTPTPSQPVPPVIQSFSQQISSIIKSIKAGAPPTGAAPQGTLGKIGTALSSISALSMALIAFKIMLSAVTDTLKFVFDKLKQGIESSAKAYMESAKLAGRTSRIFQMESALAMLGINEQETSLMVQQAMFNRKSKVFAPEDTNRLIGAARVSQFGSVQQLTNMSKEFQEAMNDAASNARQMEQSSKAGMILSMEMKAIGREFNTLLVQTVHQFYPVIYLFFTIVKGFLEFMNQQMEMVNKILQLLHLIPQTGLPGQARTMGMASPTSVTGWERIGFVFGASARDTALQQIALNTRETAKTLKEIQSMYSGKSGLLAQPSNFGLPMLPSMP